MIIIQNERRDMLTDRGANVDLSPEDVSDAMLAHARLLHVTGHTLLNNDGYARVRTLIQRCNAAEVLVSVSPGSAGFIQDLGVELARRAFAGADLIFVGLEDGKLLSGVDDPEAAVLALNEQFKIAILTRGSEGVIVSEGGNMVSFSIDAMPVVDPTGAGDAFCAGFLKEWVSSSDVQRATKSGIDLAARAVGILGGRPL